MSRLPASRSRAARTLVVGAGAIALATSACASVPDGSVDAAALACPEGSDCYDPPRAPGDGGAFVIEAFDFGFSEPEGLYWSGDIAVTMDNLGPSEHNIAIVGGTNEGSDSLIQGLGGEVVDGVFNLFPGSYTYYCTISGHRALGMEGELTIYATEAEAAENLEATGTATSTDAETDAPDADATESDTDAPDADATESETEG